MTLLIMNREFELLGEIALFESLEMTASYYGIGGLRLHLALSAPCAEELQTDRILFMPDEPDRVFLIEDRQEEGDRLTIQGCELKGETRKRLCVPPASLPARLYKYENGWREITDRDDIAALLRGDVYEGYSLPEEPFEGMAFLDMADLAAAYSWDAAAKTGEVWLDLNTARLRSRYRDFGYDAVVLEGESAMRHYAENNMINAEDARRNIESLSLAAADLKRGEILPWRARFEPLSDMLEKIGAATGLGYRIRLDFALKKCVFEVMEGRDLTAGEKRVVISKEMGNATQTALKARLSGTYTTCYAGGAGQDEQRLILSVGNEAQGAARREMFTDAGSREDAEALKWAAQRKLDQSLYKPTLTAEMISSGACRYLRDWDVGDIVTLRHGDRQMNTRILSVTRVFEADRPAQLKAVFESEAATVSDVMRRGQGAVR